MGNIYKGHILRGRKQNRPWETHSKNSYQVEIVEYKPNGRNLGYGYGETLEKARVDARKKVDELIGMKSMINSPTS